MRRCARPVVPGARWLRLQACSAPWLGCGRRLRRRSAPTTAGSRAGSSAPRTAPGSVTRSSSSIALDGDRRVAVLRGNPRRCRRPLRVRRPGRGPLSALRALRCGDRAREPLAPLLAAMLANGAGRGFRRRGRAWSRRGRTRPEDPAGDPRPDSRDRHRPWRRPAGERLRAGFLARVRQLDRRPIRDPRRRRSL